MSFKSTVKGLFQTGAKVAPYAGAAIGGAFGGPAGAAAGYKAGKMLDKTLNPPAKAALPTAQAQTASSLGEARSQDKARMKRQYGLSD